MHKLVPTLAVLGLTAAPAAAVLDAGSALAADHAGATSIVQCDGHAQKAPRTLTLFCGDGNDTLTGLHWSGWGSATSTSSGKDVIDSCSPSCVAGHDHSYRVSVSARDLQTAGSGQRYSRLTVTFDGTRPHGTPKVEHFKLTSHGPALS